MLHRMQIKWAVGLFDRHYWKRGEWSRTSTLLPYRLWLKSRNSHIQFSSPSVNMILTRLHLVLFLVATLLLCLVRLTDQSGMRLGKAFCIDILSHGQVLFACLVIIAMRHEISKFSARADSFTFSEDTIMTHTTHNIFLLYPFH